MREIKVYLQHTLLSIYPLTTLEIPSGVEVSNFNPAKFKNKVVEWMARTARSQVVMIHTDPSEVLLELEKLLLLIPAAGGLVENGNGALLLMKRRGFWDLPKGKIDDGETIEEAAVREVREETGLQAVQLGPFIITTFHAYFLKNQACLKPSHWYWMKVEGVPAVHPQWEEDITEIIWITKDEVDDYLPMSLPTIRDLLLIWKEA